MKVTLDSSNPSLQRNISIVMSVHINTHPMQSRSTDDGPVPNPTCNSLVRVLEYYIQSLIENA